MAYATIEDRIDRLEALFGQFITDSAVYRKHAEERERAAEERQREAEQRHREAEDRMTRFENEMQEFKNEMQEFKEETRADRKALTEGLEAFKREMREDRREMNRRWGELSNKLGTIIEDLMAPNLPRLATEHFRFPTIERFIIRWARTRPGTTGRKTEFDAVVLGPDAVILGEAKSTPNRQHVEEFAAKVGVFFEFFPEYNGRRLIPLMGSWSITDEIVDALTERGIYALRMGDDTMELANADALDNRQPAPLAP